jgi:hypothetical protein
MSYGIVHFKKLKSCDIKGIEIHNEREKDGTSHTNPDIDWKRTQENYELHEVIHKNNYNSAVKERIKELNLPKAVRKDAVMMCGFVITSDKEFFDKLSESKQKEYFKDSYEFLRDRYGTRNVISSKVHLDEKTPHMHFYVVPIKDGRLSAKALFDKKELRQLHDDYHKNVGKKYDLERGVAGSKAQHIETARLKALTAQEKARSVEELIKPLEQHKDELESDIEAFKALRGAVIPVNEITKGIGKYKKVVNVTMSKETYDACVSAQHRADHAEYRADKAEKKLKIIESSLEKTNLDELKSQNSKLSMEVSKLRHTNKLLNNEINTIIKVLESNSDLEKAFDKAVSKSKAFSKILGYSKSLGLEK